MPASDSKMRAVRERAVLPAKIGAPNGAARRRLPPQDVSLARRQRLRQRRIPPGGHTSAAVRHHAWRTRPGTRRRRPPAAGGDGLERRDEVAQELVEVLVALVEGQPRDRARHGRQPGGQQAHLAGPGRRRQQRAPAPLQAGVQSGQQARPIDQVPAWARHEQLGRLQLGNAGSRRRRPASSMATA
jgi:hypothetical protein